MSARSQARAIRLYPPGSTEYFIEFLNIPDKDAKQYVVAPDKVVLITEKPYPVLLAQLVKLSIVPKAHVEKVEAGPKGVIVAFRDNSFANPAGLVRFVAEQGSRAKVRPDMKIVFAGDFDETHERLEGARRILRTLVALAQKKAA